MGGDGLRNAQGQYTSSAVAAGKMKDRVSEMVDQWNRQDAILQRLRGPSNEYNANLKALDAMLEENTISTKEYADQVSRLNGELDRSNGIRPAANAPVPKPATPEGGIVEGDLGMSLAKKAGGEFGGTLDSLITKGNVEAAALAAIAVEAVHLADEYIDLSNKALKFADSTHNSDQILEEQLALSSDLHQSLDATMEAYDAIRDGTDELNLSHERQIDLTREIGEAVQLSGRSLDSATGVMQKLSYAFASGTVSGRELRTIMRQYPEIAEVWTKQLGKTRTEIVKMADSGTLSVSKLMGTFDAAGHDLDEKFGKRTESLSQAWAHFKDEIVLSIGKFLETTGIIKLLGTVLSVIGTVIGGVTKALAPLGAAIGWVADKFGSLFGAVGKVVGFLSDVAGGIKGAVSSMVSSVSGAIGGVIGKLGDYLSVKEELTAEDVHEQLNYKMTMQALKDQTGQFAFLGQQARGAQTAFDAFAEVPHLFKDIGTVIDDVGRKLRLMTDPWESAPSKFAIGAKAVMDQAAHIGTMKAEVAAMKVQVDAGTLSWDTYNKKLVELVTTINGGTTPAWMAEDQLMKKAYGDLISIQSAHQTGQMAGLRYKQQWEAIQTTLNGGELPAAIKMLDSISEPLRTSRNDVAALNALLKEGAISWDDFTDAMKKVEPGSLDKVGKLMLTINAAVEDQSVAFATLEKARGQYGITSREEPHYEEQADGTIKLINAQTEGWDRATLSASAYADQLAKVIAMAPDSDLSKSLTNDGRPNSVAGIVGPADTSTPRAATPHRSNYEAEDVTKYKDALAALNAEKKSGLVNNAQYDDSLKRLRNEYDDMKSPLDIYREGIELANEKLAAHIYTIDEFNKKTKELKATMAKSTGKESLFGQLAEELDSSKEKLKTMGDLVNGFNTNLLAWIHTGKAEWGALFDQIINDLETMALKAAESKLFTGLANALSDDSGGGYIAAAGAALSKHAYGGQWTVGGGGGVDQSLQAFWANKGETVTVETQAQRSDRERTGQGGGGGRPAVVNNYNRVSDDELIPAIATRNGDRAVLNVLRRQPGAARSLMRSPGRR